MFLVLYWMIYIVEYVSRYIYIYNEVG